MPSAVRSPDVFAPSPAHHAVLLAGHAWEHDPLGRIGPLADIAAMTLAAGDADGRGGRARLGRRAPLGGDGTGR